MISVILKHQKSVSENRHYQTQQNEKSKGVGIFSSPEPIINAQGGHQKRL